MGRRETMLETVRRATANGTIGRPKGSLSSNTIKAIATKEAMIKEIEKQTGRIVNNLLLGSDAKDTSASRELLDRAFGKVIQGVDMRVAQFSLKDLSE